MHFSFAFYWLITDIFLSWSWCWYNGSNYCESIRSSEGVIAGQSWQVSQSHSSAISHVYCVWGFNGIECDLSCVNFRHKIRSTEVPTTFIVAREIVKKDGFGLNGLNKGLTATIGRNGIFNMIYFGFYHSVRDFFPAYEVCNRTIEPLHWCICMLQLICSMR